MFPDDLMEKVSLLSFISHFSIIIIFLPDYPQAWLGAVEFS